MRTNEFTGVYHMHDEISPEAYKAQRIQELKDLAEWRARHLAQIQDWSKDETRMARKAEHELNELVSRQIANERARNDPNYIPSLMSAKEWKPMGGTGFGERPVYEKIKWRDLPSLIKEPKKPSLWKRIRNLIADLTEDNGNNL